MAFWLLAFLIFGKLFVFRYVNEGGVEAVDELCMQNLLMVNLIMVYQVNLAVWIHLIITN